jgi:hypothetical protein
MNTNKKLPKNGNKNRCEKCNYVSSNKYNFTKHLLTAKHQFLTNTNNLATNVATNDKTNYEIDIYTCICGKKYKYQSSLCYHKKTCSFDEENYKEKKEKKEKEEIKNLVITLINENKEFKELLVTQQKQLTEIIPKIGNITNGSNNNSNNNTNNTNNHFNLNFFLNEQCKDALTMNQFIDRVHVTLQNLMTTNDNGLGPGLIKLINDNMNKLTIYERPIHCTDKKRETIYIKNEDAWEKDIDKEGIYNMIKKVEKKQIDNLELWTNAHPDYKSNEDRMSEYMYLINKCTSSIEACRNKVVRNMCGEFFVKE